MSRSARCTLRVMLVTPILFTLLACRMLQNKNRYVGRFRQALNVPLDLISPFTFSYGLRRLPMNLTYRVIAHLITRSDLTDRCCLDVSRARTLLHVCKTLRARLTLTRRLIHCRVLVHVLLIKRN